MASWVPTSLIQLLDDDGDPLNGGSVTVYAATTTTPLSLFSNEGLSTPAANPIVLDSAGRHGIRYFATASYKLLVKDSGGNTVFERDSIDPGIAIGTGDLPIADGGTGASTAPAALANLGGATAAELAALAAEVATISGALGSSEKTHIATGTTAQRPATPIEGDVRRNTTNSLYEGYTGAAWVAFATTVSDTDVSASDTQEGLIELATQAEMETGTDIERAITPGRQKYGQPAAKAWGRITWAAGVPSLSSPSYNIAAGVTDTGTGDFTITFTTALSSAIYAAIATAHHNGGGARSVLIHTAAAGTLRMTVRDDTGSPVDPDAVSIVVFGDLP